MGVRKLDVLPEEATLNLGEEQITLPIVYGSEGEKAIDISKLRAQSGFVTLDPAYVNTASCSSNITFLNGEQGILHYRGHAIENLAEKHSFLSVAQLLLDGELNEARLQEMEKEIAQHGELHNSTQLLLKSFPPGSHPMAMLSAAVMSLAGEYPDLLNDLNTSERLQVSNILIAQMKTLVAAIYRHIQGLDYGKTQGELSYSEDFMQLMFRGSPHDSHKHNELIKAMDVLLILHADHEQNCSTSTVRLVGSSKANVFASIAAGINALSGPSHGGANQAVIEMLEQIELDGGNYQTFLEKAKDPDDPFKLMGFGHRVYKNFDPRAKIIKKSCDAVLSRLGIDDPLLTIAKGLEQAALSDPYFIKRKLYPNVDFYSGIIYKAFNIPSPMFTTLFALGRLPGWLAQWHEMLSDKGMKIGRPRQVYMGKPLKD